MALGKISRREEDGMTEPEMKGVGVLSRGATTGRGGSDVWGGGAVIGGEFPLKGGDFPGITIAYARSAHNPETSTGGG